MRLYHNAVTATDANTSLAIPFPCTSLVIENRGDDTVIFNVSASQGDGVAVVDGDTENVSLMAGSSITLTPRVGDIRRVGLICAAGESTLVHLTGQE